MRGRVSSRMRRGSLELRRETASARAHREVPRVHARTERSQHQDGFMPVSSSAIPPRRRLTSSRVSSNVSNRTPEVMAARLNARNGRPNSVRGTNSPGVSSRGALQGSWVLRLSSTGMAKLSGKDPGPSSTRRPGLESGGNGSKPGGVEARPCSPLRLGVSSPVAPSTAAPSAAGLDPALTHPYVISSVWLLHRGCASPPPPASSG